MKNSISYLLASLTLCSLVFGWWIGGYDWFISTGWLNIVFCTAIFGMGVVYYIGAFSRPSLAWVGADNCISAGLLGTVVGLLLALPNFQDAAVALQGIALALLTTAVGLVCNLLLYNHGYHLGMAEEESLQ